MELITDTHAEHIRGVLSCFDRIVIQGTLPVFCHAEGMASFLTAKGIRIFDYPKFAQSLRDAIIDTAERIAHDNNVEIEYIRQKNFRKEDRISAIIKKRGEYPGLLHIFSTLEPCTSYKPWHDKKTHRTFLKYDSGKCLHYYFYLIDEQLGLCYVRVPTWCPFRLQIYFNGHSWLAAQLRRRHVQYNLLDNAFISIDDFQKAQRISDNFDVRQLHKILNGFAQKYCPVIKDFQIDYHWSIMQAEYATDIVFTRQKYLQAIYDKLTRTAIHTVKPQNIATFLGKKFHGNYQDKMGNDFSTRIQGTRLKHTMGSTSIKMYDKFGMVLRIETTSNNISFFEHYREVEHRDGTHDTKVAHMKKNIYSLVPLRKVLVLANHRYLEFISAIDDKSAGIKNLNRISKDVVEKNRLYKGFNFFNENDQQLFLSIISGEFNIRGFQNKDLRTRLLNKSTGQICRMLKRLRVHGLIKKIIHSYKYHLTSLGRKVITMGLKLKELVIIPELAV